MTFHQYNIELKSIPIETETIFFIRKERKKIIIQIRHNGLKGKNGPLCEGSAKNLSEMNGERQFQNKEY